jgi:hypothetical protein
MNHVFDVSRVALDTYCKVYREAGVASVERFESPELSAVGSSYQVSVVAEWGRFELVAAAL